MPEMDNDQAVDTYSPTLRWFKQGVRIDGDAFDPKRVAYLIELYDSVTRRTVVKKGAQLGLTSWAILTVIDRMLSKMYPRGVLYCFPTEDEVFDFAQSRFNRMLSDNAQQLGQVVKQTDRTMLKRIGDGFLYFRGMRVSQRDRRPTKLLSIPADCLVLDEYDDMDPMAIDTVMKRLDSSSVGHWIKLGHPTIPELGMDLEYIESDQRRWFIPCKHCGEWTCMEEEFPECLKKQKDGTVIRVCRGCSKEIHMQQGEWVPAFKDRPIRGYWVSQLLSDTKNLDEILEEHEKVMTTGRGLALFHNMVLGLAYADMDQALDREQVLRLCDENTVSTQKHEGPTFGGADVGKKFIHACFGIHNSENVSTYLCFPEIENFDQLYDLSKAMHCKCLVIDCMAEARSVGAYIDRDYNAWGCRYVEGQFMVPKWGDDRIVVVNRTQTLDESHHRLVNKQIKLHRINTHLDREVSRHLTNLVRVIHEDDKSGQRVARWIVRGAKNDHWRHALNYAEIAGLRVGLSRKALRSQDSSAYDDKPVSWEAI